MEQRKKIFKGATAEESAAIWENADAIVKAWHAEYTEMRNTPDVDFKEYPIRDAEFTKAYYANSQRKEFAHTPENLRPTRTTESLEGWRESTYFNKEYELDQYGGWINEEMKQEATGVFYVKKLDGRWFYIDPLGYPCITIGVVGPCFSYAKNQQQFEAATAKYGDSKTWAEKTVRHLKDDLGFNLVMPWAPSADDIFAVPNGPVYQKSTYPLTEYGLSKGVAKKLGSTFFDDKAMPVFDPDFPTFADSFIKETVAPYLDDKRVVGFTTDNEIPIEQVMLDNYMALDADEKPWHRYSYAAVWTWLRFMTGKDEPAAEDVTDELRELFRGFVYYRYFSVIAPIIRRHAPKHLYGGVRFFTPSLKATLLNAEWVVRFAGRYCDYICVNWYRRYWTLPSSLASDLTKWSGDKPFLITEFYSKADLKLPDGTEVVFEGAGGGFLVDGAPECDNAQQARADHYENTTLSFLEWKNIIGWHWYRYNHYWVNGKPWVGMGIVDDNHEPYPELERAFKNINNHVYALAEFFDERNAK